MEFFCRLIGTDKHYLSVTYLSEKSDLPIKKLYLSIYVSEVMSIYVQKTKLKLFHPKTEISTSY